MDRSLDEIVSERHGNGRGPRRGGRGRGGGRLNDRNDFPRDGIRKSTREEHRSLDSEWVHDKYDDRPAGRAAYSPRRRSPEPYRASSSTKIRVENLHYDLTEEDLDDLFNRIGPVVRLNIQYDRAGRSEGTAYVTYESPDDARIAIREYDGANANGQPIRLNSIPDGPAKRNPFDSVVAPGRSLADRITPANRARGRSLSPTRHSNVSGPPPANVDRYVPGQNGRSRSPVPRRRDGRPPGARRERGERGGRGRGEGGGGAGRRPKKTQEELDAEMDDYFGGGGKQGETEVAPVATGFASEDVDMIE